MAQGDGDGDARAAQGDGDGIPGVQEKGADGQKPSGAGALALPVLGELL